MKQYQSIVNRELLSSFSEIRGTSLCNHVANSYDVEAALGFAHFYCPDITVEEDCVFISEFYNGNIEQLKNRFQSRKEIELFVNSWSLESLLAYNKHIQNIENLMEQFAESVRYFWQMRVDALFPNRNILVEIRKNFMGEEGLTVTMYQE